MNKLILIALLVAPCLAGPSPARSAPEPSPKAQGELDVLIDRLSAGAPADGFAQLEDFVQAEDQQNPTQEAAKRARQVVARFEDIKKAVPPPVEKQAGELAQLLYTSGRALESGGAVAEAKPVYERIIKDYPGAVWEGGVTKETIAAQAQARLRWQQEKHPWMQASLDTLMKSLREAFAKHDTKALGSLIARAGFWSGPFASEGGADDPDRVLKLLDSTWGKIEVAPEMEPFSEKEKQVFLKVSGFTGNFATMYCILEREPDGWQWSAVAFAEKPGSEAAVPEPDAAPSATPATPAPPSAAPSPRASVRAP